VCLAYSTNADVRLTYLAQAWREPRSFTTRYATLLAGLSVQQSAVPAWPVSPRRSRTPPSPSRSAITCLYVNIHHGHWQSAMPRSGGDDMVFRADAVLFSFFLFLRAKFSVWETSYYTNYERERVTQSLHCDSRSVKKAGRARRAPRPNPAPGSYAGRGDAPCCKACHCSFAHPISFLHMPWHAGPSSFSSGSTLSCQMVQKWSTLSA
jgi:hypothetical protein